jgi:protein gp37
VGDSKIEWTDKTWNPVVGCTKVSAGCKNCYAKALHDQRHKAHVEGKAVPAQYANPFEVVQLMPERLRDPLSWRKPQRVFVNSVSDLFHEDIPDEFIDKVFAVMALTPEHTYQVLTKRPERMAEYSRDPQTPYRVARQIDVLLVAEEMEGVEEEVRPIEGRPSYFVSNLGKVYTQHGSAVCTHCGSDVGGIGSKRYCSKKCKQNAAYHRKAGHTERFASSLKELSPNVGEQGHCRVTLYRDGVQERELVHRLVLTAFVRPALEGEQGCHRDGNARNNHICNLRWGTQSDNWEDRRRHGNGRSYSKLSPEEVETVRVRLASGHPASRLAKELGVSDTQIRNIDRYNQWADAGRIEWPLANCWKGASIENQAAADERIPHLLATPAAVRFLSCEPLLGPVDLSRWLPDPEAEAPCDEYDAANHATAEYDGLVQCAECGHPKTHHRAHGLGWVIVGGESGPGARPMAVEWARSLVRQCKAAGVPVFVKQLGADPAGDTFPADERAPATGNRVLHVRQVLTIRDKKGGDPAEWPADLRVREFPQATA